MKTMTVAGLRAKKDQSQKIKMLTAYDATMAALFDHAGVDALLVGDSLGMVIQGQKNTLAVSLEHIIYHTQAVVRGSKQAHIIADMPFLSYQVSPGQALLNAGRLIQEGGAHAVKIEGGEDYSQTIGAITRAGIPVMGHVGLMPQRVHATGGYKIQGKSPEQAAQIIADALAVEAAGAYAIVLECIPQNLAADITQALSIPTIGIGAGPYVDGQVLVGQDLLGMNPNFKPKFVRQFAELHKTIDAATKSFFESVDNASFPNAEESFGQSRANGSDGVPYQSVVTH